jgi:hypothetical protein
MAQPTRQIMADKITGSFEISSYPSLQKNNRPSISRIYTRI